MKKRLSIIFILLLIILTGCSIKKEKEIKKIKCVNVIKLDDIDYNYEIIGYVSDNKINKLTIGIYNNKLNYETGKDYSDKYNELKEIYKDNFDIRTDVTGYITKDVIKVLPNNKNVIEISLEEFEKNVKDFNSDFKCEYIKE